MIFSYTLELDTNSVEKEVKRAISELDLELPCRPSKVTKIIEFLGYQPTTPVMIRNYIKEGVMSEGLRPHPNQAFYDLEHIVQIVMVRFFMERGLKLQEIKQVYEKNSYNPVSDEVFHVKEMV